MMKLLFAIFFVLSVTSSANSQDRTWSWGELEPARIKGGAIEYVPPKKLKKLPIPVLLFVNDREELGELREEVVDKIIYPFLCESEVPILVITVDLCPEILGIEDDGKRGCDKNGDSELTVRLDISGADGSESMRMIGRNRAGGFDKDAYLKLLPEGFAPKGKCASEGGKQ